MKAIKVKIVLIVVLSVVSLLGMSSRSPQQDNGYKIGEFAADFELPDVSGDKISMSMIRYSNAKGFIIVFTCNHCPFSRKYEERIIALSKKYEPLGFPLIAINSNDAELEPADGFDKMQQIAKEKKYPFPYLHDESQHTAYYFGAKKTPQTYVLKKEAGKYKVCYMGAIDDDDQNLREKKKKHVEVAVDELLAGKSVSNPETRVVAGCGIKWKQ
jgi:thiol-disulfide isomerase/thioredoxin